MRFGVDSSCGARSHGWVRDATQGGYGFGRRLEVVPMETACDEALGGRVHAEPAPTPRMLRCPTSPSSGAAHDAAGLPLPNTAT
jgi:hypothetical protein